MCGADNFLGIRSPSKLGSPPHVRGGFTTNPTEIFDHRFTPACAGRIAIANARREWSRVHPRMCGADKGIELEQEQTRGSPPHVRGGSANPNTSGLDPRFTPACAGRIVGSSLANLNARVHPRMCGADKGLLGVECNSRGSPPHVRGGGMPRGRKNLRRRFTPACAGRIYVGNSCVCELKVHPRMCGADIPPLLDTAIDVGSPPHGRGGSDAGRVWGVGGVHAGMWGGDTHALHIAHHLVGSPPHVRGGSFKSERKSVPARFTPPCAGRVFLWAIWTIFPPIYPPACAGRIFSSF